MFKTFFETTSNNNSEIRQDFNKTWSAMKKNYTLIETDSLRIYILTWNLKGKKPDEELLKQILPLDKNIDIFVIGTQECMRSILASFFYSNKDGKSYTHVKSENLSALHLTIFIKKSVEPFLTEISSNSIKTGIGNIVGNKGAVAISIKYYGINFVFVNSHLAAGQKKSKDRNNDFERINSKLSLESVKFIGSSSTTLTDKFDMAFWFGDLNYRIDLTPEDIIENIDKGELEYLLDYDQLSLQINSDLIDINNFYEGKINFKPTFQFIEGTNQYNLKKKQPGWTDRILYKSKKEGILFLKEYNSYHDITYSDHKPVYALFEFVPETIELPKPDKNSKACIIF